MLYNMMGLTLRFRKLFKFGSKKGLYFNKQIKTKTERVLKRTIRLNSIDSNFSKDCIESVLLLNVATGNQDLWNIKENYSYKLKNLNLKF